MSAAPAAPARLKQRYVDEVLPQLMERFGYSTVMQAPKVEKMNAVDRRHRGPAPQRCPQQYCTGTRCP